MESYHPQAKGINRPMLAATSPVGASKINARQKRTELYRRDRHHAVGRLGYKRRPRSRRFVNRTPPVGSGIIRRRSRRDARTNNIPGCSIIEQLIE